MGIDVQALRKPPALFKFGEIVLGLLVLALCRGSKLLLRNLDQTYLVLGSLVGLLLSTVAFPFAHLFGHKPGTVDIAHGALCSLFYLASGGILTDTGSDVKGYKEGKMMLASGVFSIFLGIVFIADVLFVYFKERRASA